MDQVQEAFTRKLFLVWPVKIITCLLQNESPASVR